MSVQQAVSAEEGIDPAVLLRHRLALVLAGVLWSLGGLLIKWLTVNPIWQTSALGITFYRSVFAALCLLPLLRGRKLPSVGASVVAILLYTLMLASYVAATQGTTAANAIFLQYTAPLYALVLGPLFFGEPFRKADAGALAVAMAGIAVLFFGNFQGGERGPLLLGAGSGLMFGCFMLWMRRMRTSDPFAITTINNAGVGLVAGLALLATRPEELLLFPRVLQGETGLVPVVLVLALMGCVQIAAPYVLFSYGLKQVPSVEASLLALVEPLLNPIWVVLFIGERPTPATLLGGGLILLSLACRYALFRPRTPQNPSA